MIAMEPFPHLCTYVQGIRESPTVLCTSLKLTKVKPGTPAGEKNKSFLHLKDSPLLFSPSQSCPQTHHLFIQEEDQSISTHFETKTRKHAGGSTQDILCPWPRWSLSWDYRKQETICQYDHCWILGTEAGAFAIARWWNDLTGLPPPNPVGPWECLNVLGGDVESNGWFWAWGAFSFFFFSFLKDSFSHPFGFKIVCGSDI